ncbi:Hypothetical predicted protein [Cloeon dipterum]|uniref:GATOR2 complex protein WDR24 n=1 Tax=Cloeon dipterum TaxID=197152 RepID=A0A8S1C8P4_9INSE|nr:Hypothetical predicted protein [Cloeon dipterum]
MALAKAKTMFATQEGPANALALNKDFSQVVIAGRNVFKVFLIESDAFVEVCNLRVGKNINLNFSCNDVAWNAYDENILATAATNGAVVVWNLNKPTRSKQEHVFNDHRRTVNKVSFHQTEPFWLLSGSQDGTMKCFDFRIKEVTRTFISKTESVRDVQFSPHQMHTFAAVSENGNVQLWDLRKPEKCLHQFTAHSGPIFACDWHPETSWLATASRDKTIKVWDLATINKPVCEHIIPTIASVGHIKWRPQRKYHIASSALVVDCSVNIWDVRRPYIAFASFNEHQDVATGVAWRGDPHVILSTSKDFTLYQHVFKDAARPESKANPQGIAFNSKGDMSFSCKISINPGTLSKLPNLLRKTPQHSDQFCSVTSSMHTFLSKAQKEVKCFLECARRYQLSGKPLAELCDHNAAVAKQLGRHQVSLVWGVVKTLYCTPNMGKVTDLQQTPSGKDSRDDPNITPGGASEAHNGTDLRHTDKNEKGEPNGVPQNEDNDTENEEPEQQDRNLSTIATGLAINQGDFFFGDGAEGEMDQLRIDDDQMSTEDMHQEWTLPTEAFNLRHEIEDRSPPPEQFPNHCAVEMFDVLPDEGNLILPLMDVIGLPRLSHWDPSEVIASALNKHAESSDVQTAASVLLVLGEKRTALIDEFKQEQWILGYLELLGRHKLWNTATQVIKHSWLPSITQLNQQSTTLPTNCETCSRPLRRSGWHCDNCRQWCGKCAVCNELVKGVFSWCQGCSHGGHLAHMHDWLQKHRLCPAGCGHACEYD